VKHLLLALKGFALAVVLLLGAGLLAIPLSIVEYPSDLLAVENNQSLALDHVTIVDVESGELLADRQLLIADGAIVAIAEAGAPVESSYRRIDAQSAYIVPGLFDMHVHVHDRKYLGLYLAYGVTTVRNMRGLPMHLRWQQELRSARWLGSNLHTSSPVLDGEKYAHALQQVVTSAERARKLVRRYQQRGYDFIKAYGYLQPEVFQAIVDEATLINMPVAKHGPNAIAGLPLRSNDNLQSLEHVEDIFQGPLASRFDREALAQWLVEFKQLDAALTPTLATFHHLTEISTHKQTFLSTLPLETLNPFYRLLYAQLEVKRWLEADEAQAQWNRREFAFLQEIVKLLEQEGIALLLGSDAGTMHMPPGISTLTEVELMMAAGLLPLTVLRAATINAAKALAVQDQYGTVTPGKIADLILLESNPLLDLSTLRQPLAVIKAGQWLGTEQLQALKRSGANPSNVYISFGRLLEDVLSRALPW